MTELEAAKTAIAKLGLRCLFDFVPMADSRNVGQPHLSFNYRVTLTRDGKEILTTDYSMGLAYSPSHRQNDETLRHSNRMKLEVSTGKVCRISESGSPFPTSKKIEPDETDVILSLVRDADVLHYGRFEDWASEFGYDADSRKAEAIYQTALKNTLALKAAIGIEALTELELLAREI